MGDRSITPHFQVKRSTRQSPKTCLVISSLCKSNSEFYAHLTFSRPLFLKTPFSLKKKKKSLCVCDYCVCINGVYLVDFFRKEYSPFSKTTGLIRLESASESTHMEVSRKKWDIQIRCLSLSGFTHSGLIHGVSYTSNAPGTAPGCCFWVLGKVNCLPIVK
jgi:hypothetical protein